MISIYPVCSTVSSNEPLKIKENHIGKDLGFLIKTARVTTLQKHGLPGCDEMTQIVMRNIEQCGYTIKITNSEGYGNITGSIMLIQRLMNLSENIKIKLIFDDEIDVDNQMTAEDKFNVLCASDERMKRVLVSEFDEETPIIGLTGVGDVNYADIDQASHAAETLTSMSNCNTWLHCQPYGYNHSSRAIYSSMPNGEIAIAKFGDNLKATGYDLRYVEPGLSELVSAIPECTRLSAQERSNLQNLLQLIHEKKKNVVLVYGIDQYSHAASAVVSSITGALARHPDTIAFVVYSGSQTLDSCVSLQEFDANSAMAAIQCKGINKKIFDYLISQAKFAAFEGAGTFATAMATKTPFVLFSQPDTITSRFAFKETDPTIGAYEEPYEATTITISRGFKAKALETLFRELHEKLTDPIFSNLQSQLRECAEYLTEYTPEEACQYLKASIASIKSTICKVEISFEMLLFRKPAMAKRLEPVMNSLNILKSASDDDIRAIFDNSVRETLVDFVKDAHDEHSGVNNYMHRAAEYMRNEADQVVIGLYHIFARPDCIS